MKRYFNNYKKYAILLLTGMFLGWLLFHNHGASKSAINNSSDQTVTHPGEDEQEGSIWTCAMHPQIRMDKPGKCPICGMDLIPLSQNGNVSVDADAVHLSEEARALANVQTTIVSGSNNMKQIRLYGKVQADERLVQSQVSHIPGRIEKLYVNFTGENVKAGQPLAEIYSPDLVTAEQELLQTAETKNIQPELYAASKEKLRQWKLTDSQINEIESSGSVISNFKILSNTTGTVTSRLVNNGDHVIQGSVLFTVVDLSKVWVLFDAYESDLSFILKGKPVTFTLQSFPGKEFNGVISFIDPVVDPLTRVTRVRVEYDNKDGELKPEMFATGIISGNLAGYDNSLSIPASAVLWTGKRSIVYVKQPGMNDNLFKMREIELGPALGDNYIVLSGLSKGEEVVTNGTFSVDASAQLEGKPSMMNPSGGQTAAGHDHGKMSPTTKEVSENIQDTPGKSLPAKKDTGMDLMMKMNMVYDNYIALKNSLVNSDQTKAKENAAKFKKVLSEMKMNVKTDKSMLDITEKMIQSAETISSSSTIEKQRSAFAVLSDQLYDAVKNSGLMGKTTYYQFCPMARDGKGAYWLSETNEIRNPYYGESMLTCGETRETIKY
ncbi:MAG TPA: efflux RND transporter periplasmic adaptor subunit [Bacteroidales bacterium]|nr:efflux RND transporter periplasmic adaptor subunit [Bacteroidales bacterium]